MGRSEEFHNGTHVLEPGEVWGPPNSGRQYHQAHCAKCATTFTGHDSQEAVAAAHRDYVGTPEAAAARRESRVKSQQALRERYDNNIIGPDAVRGAMSQRPYSAER